MRVDSILPLLSTERRKCIGETPEKGGLSYVSRDVKQSP